VFQNGNLGNAAAKTPKLTVFQLVLKWGAHTQRLFGAPKLSFLKIQGPAEIPDDFAKQF
jgi:hypothetical protein